MKKILIMAKALGGGGAEVAMIELLNQLDYSEYQIKLVLLDNDREYQYRLKKKIEIEQIRFRSGFAERMVSMYSFTAKVLKKISFNHFLPYYDRIFDKIENVFDEEYDIALDFYGYGYFLTGFLAKRIKAKKKATWLHDEKMDWLKNTDRYLSAYDKIFCVSQAVADAFVKKYPDLKSKVEVFYNVIDITAIIEKSKETIPLEFDNNTFNILTVGRLTEQKGYDIAIQAAAIIKSRGLNFRWYAIGMGRDEAKLKAMAEKYGISSQFIFLGRKDNPYPYMANCSLYVQPSRHEGYVITLVEARALAVPIVSSDIPSLKEQIQHGVNGYLTKLSPEKLSEEIMDIYKHPEKREKVVTYLRENKIDFSNEIHKIDMK